jgi:hypothetical protein
MPLANGVFTTREKAQEAIDNEEWEDYTEHYCRKYKKIVWLGL